MITIKEASNKGLADLDQIQYALSEERVLFTHNIAVITGRRGLDGDLGVMDGWMDGRKMKKTITSRYNCIMQSRGGLFPVFCSWSFR